MTVCQTCGVEGYTNLLTHCFHCQILAVHRYCVDGPSNIDDDEVIWLCEDCDPSKVEPSPGSRKSERIHSEVDREAQHSKVRRIWRNNLSPSKVKKMESVELTPNKVTHVASDLDEKISEIAKRKQGKSKENGMDSKNVRSVLHHPVMKKKKGLDPVGAKKDSSEATLFEGQKTKDLHAFFVDGEDRQTKLEKNLAPQLSETPDHSQETSSTPDEMNDRDFISEGPHKQGHLSSKTQSSPREEQNGFRSFQAAKQSDSVEQETSKNSKETKALSASCQRGDKESLVDVYEIQTANKKRRLVIAMEYSDSDEEPVYVKPTKVSSLEIQNCVIPQLSPVLINNYIPAQPIIDAVWRGYCRISMDVRPIAFGLEAHLSNKAHIKVHGAASALPDVLSFEIVQKQYAWPKCYEMSPPTGYSIGLYFFPVDESDEKWYEYLLDKMIDCNLMLKCCINNLELLVFCSQVLPQDERRFRSKYYLWGVFKRKQETSLTNGQPGTGINGDFGRNGSSLSSMSPSSMDNCSVVNSADSHVPHYARNHNAELTPDSHVPHHARNHNADLTPDITLKHAKPTSKKQGYIIPRKARGVRSLVRSNNHRNPRKTYDSQAYAHGSREVKSTDHERHPNLYKKANGTRQGKSAENRKGSPYRQSNHHSHRS